MKTLLLLLLLAFQILPISLSAHGVCIIDGTAGVYLQVKTSHVDVRVHNQIAVVTSTQVFTNQTGIKQPFRYAFPLNPAANAIDLTWHINGQWHKTVISTNTQSDSIPGSGGGQINPNLASYLGTNAILVTPADSIHADSSVTFIITYVELLPYAFGIVRFNYPNAYDLIQPSRVVESNSLQFALSSERTIEDIGIEQFNAEVDFTANNAMLSLAKYEEVPNGNYAIFYQLSSTELGVIRLSTFIPDSLLYCDDAGNGYVSLIIEPEANPDATVIEKNFSLIIDRSGSMSGEKIIQARQAAKFIVEHLNDGDHFNIIDFSTQVNALFTSMVPYTIANRDIALNHINYIYANGSTNISGALFTSISHFQAIDTNKANIIIFFTDGMATAGITDEEGILQAITEATNVAETNIYLFTFGIGSDVDRSLLTRMARDNGGIATFLENDEVEEKITSFFLTINNPVLLQIEYSFEPALVTHIYPDPLPNLYKGQQLILSGRYVQPGIVNLHLTGKAFNVPVSYTFPLLLADSNDIEKSFLPKIWAKQAIDHNTINHNIAPTEDQKDSIQSIIDTISVCYNVISTQFTSFEDGGGISSLEFDETPLSASDFIVWTSPNPFTTDVTVHIRSKSNIGKPVIMVIVDAGGHPVYRLDLQYPDPDIDIPVLFPATLPAGVYFVILLVGKERIITEIVKM